VRRVIPRRSRGFRRLSTRSQRLAALAAGVSVCAIALAGCGQSKQDAKEPNRAYTVAVSDASFPVKQAIARPTTLRIAVANKSSKTIPNVAVTVNSLTYRATQPPHLADPERPTWIIYDGPGPAVKSQMPVESEEVTKAGGGETANSHTWALGPLTPGATKVFAWKLLPVLSGTKVIHYEVAAGLNGRAKAQLAGGGSAAGSLTVHIAPAPPNVHVDPETGAVLQGPYTASAGPVGVAP
jgi:hypothetical protein